MTVDTAHAGPPAKVSLSAPLDDLDQAWRIAVALAQSDLVPWSLQNKPSNVLLVMMMGRDLDLNPAQAVRSIYVPSNGRPQLTGQLALARVRGLGHDYEYEDYDEGCTFTLIRGDTGKPFVGKFTLEDAKQARLVTEVDGVLMARSQKGQPL